MFDFLFLFAIIKNITKEKNMVFTILSILHELMKNQKVTATHIAEKYEISVRSVYRYVNHLSASGFPILTTPGKNGGIHIDKNVNFNNIFKTKTQVCYLMTLCFRCPLQNETTRQLYETLKQILHNNSYN